MKLIDISMSVTEDIQTYKRDESAKPKFKTVASHKNGNVHATNVTLNMHTGTHMDAPLHMIKNGKVVKDTDINKLVTRCKVIDLTDVPEGIEKHHLKGKGISKGDFILIKTKNSFTNEFEFDFTYVAKSGAEYLVEAGIKGVGIDGLGIERAQPGHETHKTILGNDIPIIEGLRLKHVEPGEYTLIALPIKLPNTEASPVRAVLLPNGAINV